ncbi:glycosyltransferase family 4 protein [Novosphingobium huizhouense]|uniref:glycosyltransferase family 4 protein n=1 Tax=Novosphingobium huizhouense TaxID=2866625 RepID=UPI001CD8B0DC|nr:glycosyltransferase family 4 protein [Novosphingobium huizhouense]
MRIALIATHHADYAANLAAALAERHEVLLILSRRNAGRQIRPEAMAWLKARMEVRIVPHHLAPLQPLVALLCARHIARFDADVVHVQEHPTHAMAQLATLLRGRVPLVTTVHDPLPHSGDDARAAQVYAKSYALLRAASDRILVHGDCLVRALAGTGVAADKVAAVPHGVLRFGRHGAGVPRARPAPARLIFFGRMEAYKGLEELLAANALWLQADPAAGPRPELVIAGCGPELSRLAPRLDAPNITLLRGRIDQAELESLVATSTAAVLPYRDATQSGVIASSFGAGRPVIATRVGALPGAVGDAGLLVPQGDVAALAQAGLALVRDAGLRTRLERAVEARCAEALCWQKIAGQTLELYAEARGAAARARRHSPALAPAFT